MKKVTYEDLTSEILHDTKSDILIVNKDDEDFYFKFRLKPGNSNLVVFSNGAVDFSKSKPPVFSDQVGMKTMMQIVFLSMIKQSMVRTAL